MKQIIIRDAKTITHAMIEYYLKELEDLKSKENFTDEEVVRFHEIIKVVVSAKKNQSVKGRNYAEQ